MVDAGDTVEEGNEENSELNEHDMLDEQEMEDSTEDDMEEQEEDSYYCDENGERETECTEEKEERSGDEKGGQENGEKQEEVHSYLFLEMRRCTLFRNYQKKMKEYEAQERNSAPS